MQATLVANMGSFFGVNMRQKILHVYNLCSDLLGYDTV